MYYRNKSNSSWVFQSGINFFDHIDNDIDQSYTLQPNVFDNK